MTFKEFVQENKVTMAVLEGPTVEITKDNRLEVRFKLEISYNGRSLKTKYHMGTGFIKLPNVYNIFKFDGRMEPAFNTLKRNPYAEFKDKELQRDFYQICVKIQKLVPEVHDVLQCLALDAQAFFNQQSFSEWCADFGANNDSIQAKKTYKACLKNCLKLSRTFGPLAQKLMECTEE